MRKDAEKAMKMAIESEMTASLAGVLLLSGFVWWGVGLGLVGGFLPSAGRGLCPEAFFPEFSAFSSVFFSANDMLPPSKLAFWFLVQAFRIVRFGANLQRYP